jgi:hypothetical protein
VLGSISPGKYLKYTGFEIHIFKLCSNLIKERALSKELKFRALTIKLFLNFKTRFILDRTIWQK